MGSYTGSSSFAEAVCVGRLVFLLALLAVVVFWVGAAVVVVIGAGLGFAFMLDLFVVLLAAAWLTAGAAVATFGVATGAAAGVAGAVGGMTVF